MTRRRKILIMAGVMVAAAAVAIGALALSRPEPQSYTTSGPATRETYYAADYAAVLKTYVDAEGMVDYAALKKDPERLNAYVHQLATLSPKVYEDWDDASQIALWVNAYNALTLKVIVETYPIKARLLSSLRFPENSIRQIPGVWDKIHFTVMGRELTLNEMEHEVLRKEFDEPLIHVALVCAAMGCPKLRNEPFVGKRLDEQLNDQARDFLANPDKFRIDRDAGRVHLSSILKWFEEDFVRGHKPESGFASGRNDEQKAVLNFIAGYLPDDEAEYLETGNYTVEYLDYDWSLNEQNDAE